MARPPQSSAGRTGAPGRHGSSRVDPVAAEERDDVVLALLSRIFQQIAYSEDGESLTSLPPASFRTILAEISGRFVPADGRAAPDHVSRRRS